MRVAAPNIPMLCTGNIVILSSAILFFFFFVYNFWFLDSSRSLKKSKKRGTVSKYPKKSYFVTRRFIFSYYRLAKLIEKKKIVESNRIFSVLFLTAKFLIIYNLDVKNMCVYIIVKCTNQAHFRH